MANIGDMDRYLSLEVLTTSVGSAGTSIESWEEEKKIWAAREEVGNTYIKEDYEGDQKVASGEVHFVIWETDIQADTHRIVDGSEVYDILGVQEEDAPKGQFNRGMQLRLRCERKDND